MATDESIVEEFETFGVRASPDVVLKCINLCNQHGLDAETLAVEWVTFSANKNVNHLNLDLLDDFDRDYLSRRKANPTSTKKLSQTKAKPCFSDMDDKIMSAYGGSPVSNVTPRTPRNQTSALQRAFEESPLIQNLSPNVSRRSQRFAERANPGAVVLSYSTPEQSAVDISDYCWSASNFKPKIKCNSLVNDDCKIMFEKARATADMAEEAILHMADEISAAFGGGDCWSAMDNTSNVTINSVGRICCDSRGKINAASVLMESSRKYGSALVQRLDFSKLDEFAVFPGQIVGVSGINLYNDRLICEFLIGGRVLPFSDAPITLSEQAGPLQLVIACGPFTTPDNLLYEPLSDLLSTVAEAPPHLLLLLGPLLDMNHPLLSEASTTETYQDVVNRVLTMVMTALNKCNTEVYYVSCHRDITSSGVYPTAPLITSVPHPRLHCVSDPCTLEVEGVVIAVTSIDILMDLSKEEAAHPPSQGDRLSRLVHHILSQQCLYPLSPAPDHVSVSPSLLQGHATLNCRPHVLVLPSDIKHFVKDVNDCLAINPGRLCKGTSGFYSRVQLERPAPKMSKPEAVAAILRV